MEESDIRMSILCNADEKDLERRNQHAAKVARILMTSEKLFNVISVPKGKVSRSKICFKILKIFLTMLEEI